MNKILTSEAAIITAAKNIVMQQGLQGLNIREVASKCGVCVGSIYNYFPSKNDLVIATVEAIWKDIFSFSANMSQNISFCEYVSLLFENILKGFLTYPSFFAVHSLSITSADKGKGRQLMYKYFAKIKSDLLDVLNTDSRVNTCAFNETLSKDNFIDFVFSNIVTLLMNNSKNCSTLTEIIKRTIY